jgi:nicotinamidase-related amidase
MAVRSDSKLAVIVLGMQNDLLHPDGFFPRSGYLPLGDGDRELIVGNVQRVLARTRATNRPLFHAFWSFRPDYLDSSFSLAWRQRGLKEQRVLVEGTWGAQFVDGIDTQPDDFILPLKSHSAFQFTHLDRTLRNCGAEAVALVGGTAAESIDDTARQGAAYGYRILLVRDTIAPLNSPHLATLRTRGEAIDTDDLLELLEAERIPIPIPVRR